MLEMVIKTKKYLLWVSLFAILLVAASFFSLRAGSMRIPLQDMIPAIFDGEGTVEHNILTGIRIPRILLGIFVGGSLSLAGVMLQAMFRNPLVEPYTIGISGGAAFGICLNMALGINRILGLYTLPLSGFVGAVAIVLIVYSLNIKRGVLKLQGLLLSGVMISFVSSSLIMLIMALTRTQGLRGMIFWIMGSLEEPNTDLIKLTGMISVLGLIISYFFARTLNAMNMGEEEARHLGVDVERAKRLLFFLTSVFTAASVSVAGIIGFVGLIVPHFVRLFVGSDHRILLISAFLVGAGFLVFCDTIARTMISPVELPVGVITGIIGGILFIFALNKKKSPV